MQARVIANTVPIILDNANISFGTKLHGGFDIARVRVHKDARLNSSRIEMLYFQRLIITDNTRHVFFDGRVMGIVIGPDFIEIEGHGWGITSTMDTLYESTSETQTNVSDIITEILDTTYCPELVSTTGNINYISFNNTQAMRKSDHPEYPFEIVSRLSSLSDTSGNMWAFAVWEGKIPVWYNVYSNRWTQFWVVKEGSITFSTSAEDLRNKVKIIYLDSAGTQTSSAYSSDIQAGHPTREAELTVTRVITAANARDKLLNQMKRPQAGLQLQLTGTIQKRFAGRFPVSYVRAGDFIDISGLKLTAAGSNIDLKSVLVLSTNYSNGVLTVTPAV